MVAGAAALNQLTADKYSKINEMGAIVRNQLQTVFDELDVEAQVTGIGSFFGMHFCNHEIVDYKTMKLADQRMKNMMFKGLLDQGILLFAKCTGALSVTTGEKEIEQLVNSVRHVTSTTLKNANK